MTTPYNAEKFRELVLYVAAKSQDDRHFGDRKLAATLYFCDFIAYGEFGTPITGAVYQKFQDGPFPQPLYDAQRDLYEQEAARMEQATRYISPQNRLVPLREADLALFTPAEIELVDGIIGELRPYSSKEAENIARDEPGWKATPYHTAIPYLAAFLSPDPPTAEDIAWVQSLPRQVEVEAAR
jgi:hypothetical protein